MQNNREIARKITYLALVVLKLSRKDAEKRMRRIGLSQLQTVALRLIKLGHATIAEISKRLMLEPATLVPVVDALESKKLLIREHDPKDRRRNILKLTARGAKILGTAPLSENDTVLAGALSELGAKEAAELTRLLEKLVAILQPPAKTLRDLEEIMKI